MKNKIKVSVLMMLLFQVCINPLFSQENPKNEKASIPKHEFGISVGIGSSAGYSTSRYSGLFSRTPYPFFFNASDNLRSLVKTPTLNVNYYRNINNFFTLSFTASVTQIIYSRFDYWVQDFDYYNNHYVTFMVGPRFNWFNSKNVRLYSTTSTGLGLNCQTSKHWNYNNYEEVPLGCKFYFDFQISPIGIILYDRINVELGFGGTGFFKFGVVF